MKGKVYLLFLLKSMCVLWIVLLPGVVCAQKEKKDTTRFSIKNFVPTGVRVGTDVLAIGKGYYKKSFSGWEVNGDVDFYRYLLAADYGGWSNDIVTKNSTSVYHNEGSYYRLGIDVNFLKNDPDKNVFSLGFRRGRSVFSETLGVQIDDKIWGKVTKQYENKNVVGKWTELTMGLKVKIWKIFWMGYTARFKFGIKTSDTPVMLPYDVPGYGHINKTSAWGFNYQLMIRLPVRKYSVPASKK